jgi:hypothetical protein
MNPMKTAARFNVVLMVNLLLLAGTSAPTLAKTWRPTPSPRLLKVTHMVPISPGQGVKGHPTKLLVVKVRKQSLRRQGKRALFVDISKSVNALATATGQPVLYRSRSVPMIAFPGQNPATTYKSFRLNQNWAGKLRPKLSRSQLSGSGRLPTLHHVREHLKQGGNLPAALGVKHWMSGANGGNLSALTKALSVTTGKSAPRKN